VREESPPAPGLFLVAGAGTGWHDAAMTIDPLPDEALAALLEEAAGWAREAGALTRPWFEAGVTADAKADGSPVTIADREAERRLRALIEARFPDDGILGEEYGETRPGARRRWILDPIDGTRSFVRGVPLYGVLVGLEERDAAGHAHGFRLGVAHFPMLGETAAAARGQGCWWNGRRARVSAVERLDQALALTTSARHEGIERARWDAVAGACAAARTWGDAYGYLLVATGRADLMIDMRLALWDVAAILPVVEEAGGVITDFDGRTGAAMTNAVAAAPALAGPVRALLAAAGG
jgi:histidinol-phosphatase